MIRELLYRIKQKVVKEQKKAWRSGVPFQSEMTYSEPGSNWYDPILAGPSTLANDCISGKTVGSIIPIIERLTQDAFVQFTLNYYKKGIQQFGDQWRYGDINTFLYGICKNLKIANYLEIGVRRGRSMSVVASLHPEAAIVGFDMWIPNYAAMENPGPDFVRSEIKKTGYRGNLQLIVGDSHVTVPQYFQENPQAYFDLITVDGDHTIRGAQKDLETVVPRLKVGGLLIFDDICNPDHTYLRRVWRRVTADRVRFQTYEYDELGYGVAFAIKKS